LLAGKRVLVVDDLAPNRLLIKETLDAAGVQCLVAENAKEALSILAYEHGSKRQLSAIVTDYLMPEQDGVQLAGAIAADARFKSIPVIILTSVEGQDLIKQFGEAGAGAWLAKPVARQQLLDTLGLVLDAWARGEKPGLITAETAVAASARRLLAGEQPLSGMHILMVEDNRVNLEIVSEMLAGFGCKVTAARNGKEAIEAALAQAFDLIFMDCQMPEMDGYEATRRISALKAEGKIAPVPIVALTANALKDDRERCLASGMDDYLSKPIRKASLEESLLKWLRDKKETRPPVSTGPETSAPIAAQGTAVSVPPSAAAGIDVDALAAAKEASGGKFGVILGYYLEDAQIYIDGIAEALQQHDLNAALIPAHTLKSSSLQFGATELAALAARVENAARQEPGSETPEALAALVGPMREAFAHVKPFYLSAMDVPAQRPAVAS